ncbi:MAG: hypothetical protein ACK5L5_03645 [Bacteroidales bacterium]
MSKQLIYNIVLGILMVISVAFVVMIFLNIEGLESTNSAEVEKHQGVVYSAMIWSVVLLVIGALAACATGLIQLVSNPKQLIGAVIVLAIIAVVVFICYSLAGTSITETPSIKEMIQNGSLTPSIIKTSGAIVYVAVAASIIAVVSLIFAGVRNAIN